MKTNQTNTTNGTRGMMKMLSTMLCLGLLIVALCPATSSASDYTREYGALVQQKQQWQACDQRLRGMYQQWQTYRNQVAVKYNIHRRNPHASSAYVNQLVNELNRSANMMNRLVGQIQQSSAMVERCEQALIAEYHRGPLQGRNYYDVNGNPIDNSWWHSEGNGNNSGSTARSNNTNRSGSSSGNGSSGFRSESQPRPNVGGNSNRIILLGR